MVDAENVSTYAGDCAMDCTEEEVIEEGDEHIQYIVIAHCVGCMQLFVHYNVCFISCISIRLW